MRVVEAKAWQAFSATLLLERSDFGLNELSGAAIHVISSAAVVPLPECP